MQASSELLCNFCGCQVTCASTRGAFYNHWSSLHQIGTDAPYAPGALCLFARDSELPPVHPFFCSMLSGYYTAVLGHDSLTPAPPDDVAPLPLCCLCSIGMELGALTRDEAVSAMQDPRVATKFAELPTCPSCVLVSTAPAASPAAHQQQAAVEDEEDWPTDAAWGEEGAPAAGDDAPAPVTATETGSPSPSSPPAPAAAAAAGEPESSDGAAQENCSPTPSPRRRRRSSGTLLRLPKRRDAPLTNLADGLRKSGDDAGGEVVRFCFRSTLQYFSAPYDYSAPPPSSLVSSRTHNSMLTMLSRFTQ